MHPTHPIGSPNRFLFTLLALLCLQTVQANFTDVTLSVGITDYQKIERHPSDFVVRGGAPIVMDFDGNGWPDIYIVRYQLDDIIFLNDQGTFTLQTNPLGLDTKNGGNAPAWADIDNDGDKDMIIAAADQKTHLLYLNQGDGTFVEAAAARGLALPSTLKDHQGTGVSVGDINRDGYLDVIIGDWGVSVDETTRFEHYGLFLNKGAAQPGYFTNVTQESGYEFFDPSITFFTPTITDLDQDGWPDLATVVDFGKSAIHWNNANGTFTNTTQESGVGLANHAMGTAIGDIDNDGDLDWWITTIALTRNVNGEVNPLYINQGARLFKNKSVEAGIAFGGWGWGTNMFDYDLDGDLDIVMVNQEDITPEGPTNAGKMFLWRNDGNLKFTDVSEKENANYLARASGLVTFDYDKDGDLDIFTVNQIGRPLLLRNNKLTGPSWLQIGFQGTVSNRDGIGALVTAQQFENGKKIIREFNPTNTYLAQLDPHVHFGFPSQSATLHKLTIRWPSGIVQELTDVPTKQTLTIVEDESLLKGTQIPDFATFPSDQVATRGQPITLAVTIQGGFRPTITWYRNGLLLAGYEGSQITIDNMQPRNAGTYYAIATNAAGSTQTADFIIGVRSDFSDRNIVRQWNELVLDSARINFPDPPIVARTFFHCSAAMWDAYWAYQPDAWTNAQPVFHREDPTFEPATRAAQQAEAISHAVYTVAAERYRAAFNHDAILLTLRDFMLDNGYDPTNLSTEGAAPAAVGNRIGHAILDLNLEDGSNEANGYADTTGYAPVNAPLEYGQSGVTLTDPNRWQPLNLTRSITKNGIDLGAQVQQFLTPGWNWVTPFALEKPTASTILIDPGPQPLFGTDTQPQLIAQLVEVIRASSIMDPAQDITIDASPGSLQHNNPWLTQDGQGHPINPVTGQPYAPNPVNRGDYFRITAEFWSDGPGIEGPPGVWNMLHNQVVDDPRFLRKLGGTGPELTPIEWDVHAYLALNGALHDSAIAAWTIKSKYDSIRPISMIRYLASLGQSSETNSPNYNANGLPLEPGLIELITAESSAPGQRHAHLSEYIDELAVYSWKGVPQNPRDNNAGVGWVRALDWSPYHLRTFPTPNFAGYVSGHSTFSRAGAEVMSLLTGSPYFPGGLKEFQFPTGKYLQVEYGPREPVTVQVATYYDAADITGVARIYCGVHIAADDFVGRKVGARVGTDAVLKTLALRQGPSAPAGLVNAHLQLPIEYGQDSPIISYQTAKALPLRTVSDMSQATEPALYFHSTNGQLNILANDTSLTRLEVQGAATATTPLTLDFNLTSAEPATLLATAIESTGATLSLYQKTGQTYQLLQSNQNWLQNPRASLAAILTNRRDLAGAELPAHAAALPLQLATGTYRLTLTADTPITAHILLELVSAQ